MPGIRINADNGQVVEEESAVLRGCDFLFLDSDHLKLNKFTRAEDGNYVSVSANLARICAEAPGLVQRRQYGQ